MSSLINPSESVERTRAERDVLPVCDEIREQGLYINGLESQDDICRAIGEKVVGLFARSTARLDRHDQTNQSRLKPERICIAYALNPSHDTIEAVNGCVQSGVLDLSIEEKAKVELADQLPVHDPSEPRAQEIASLMRGNFLAKIIQYDGPIGLEDHSVAESSSVWSFHAQFLQQ